MSTDRLVLPGPTGSSIRLRGGPGISRIHKRFAETKVEYSRRCWSNVSRNGNLRVPIACAGIESEPGQGVASVLAILIVAKSVVTSGPKLGAVGSNSGGPAAVDLESSKQGDG